MTGGRPDGGTAVVIQTAFLGDVVLTTPLLTALAERHGPVDVVTTPGAASLLEGHPAVREVIRYDKKGADAGLAGGQEEIPGESDASVWAGWENQDWTGWSALEGAKEQH